MPEVRAAGGRLPARALRVVPRREARGIQLQEAQILPLLRSRRQDEAPAQSAGDRGCRYISRSPVTGERLALTASGHVRYALKTPYLDGTTHIVLEPLDLMARLAALVPPPRMHQTRFHGVFAPRSTLRAAVKPAHRDVGAAKPPPADPGRAPTPRHVAMSWARRLKRVRYRDRPLRALRRHPQVHRQHRGASAHREDPLASRAHGGAAAQARVAAGGAGATAAVHLAVNSKRGSR